MAYVFSRLRGAVLGRVPMRVRVLLWLLLCAVLLSQTLGLLHAIVHADLREVHASADVSVHDHSHPADFLAHLFSGHASDNDCRLYDQLSHVDTMPGTPVLVLPLVLAPFVFSVLAGLAVARWHALFQARGPPLIR